MESGRLTTAYFLPLIAMQEQVLLLCHQLHMSVRIWDASMGIEDVPDNLVIVLEVSQSDSFKSYIRDLAARGKLARIVFDEAHLLLGHQHFRDIMQQLSWIGSVGVPVIIQSATIPPSILPHVFSKLGVVQYHVCREPTSRSNISYQVVRVSSADREVKRLWDLGGCRNGKTLIFCHSKAKVEQIARECDIPHCNGTMKAEEITTLLSQLREGKIRGIVSTTVLGVALNVPDVDLIIHHGCPYNMVGYSQETGRGGRGSNTFATSIVILDPSMTPHNIVEPDYMGIRLVQDHVLDETRCRHWMLALFNDGIGMTCSMMPWITHLCDVCERESRLPTPARAVIVEYSNDAILPYLISQ